MKKLMSRLVLGAFATLLGLASTPAAYAQGERENSTFTITEPLEVGNVVLQPGTYFLRVVLLSSDRDTIQVTNPEQNKVFATVLATPHPITAGESIPQTRFVYYTASGQPKALRTWFPRDSTNGHDIVYSKQRAMELAAATREPVIAVRDEVKEAEYKSVPIEIVTPERKVTPYVARYEAPAPVQVAEARPEKELPRTASRVPLFAALGLLSLGGALGLRALANRAA